VMMVLLHELYQKAFVASDVYGIRLVCNLWWQYLVACKCRLLLFYILDFVNSDERLAEPKCISLSEGKLWRKRL